MKKKVWYKKYPIFSEHKLCVIKYKKTTFKLLEYFNKIVKYLQVMPLRKRVIIVTMASPLPPLTGIMKIIATSALYGLKEAGGTVHVRIAV